MTYNQTPWARACNDAAKYVADAIGHGLDTDSGVTCLGLADKSLEMARRAAAPDVYAETEWVAQLNNAISALKQLPGIGFGGGRK